MHRVTEKDNDKIIPGYDMQADYALRLIGCTQEKEKHKRKANAMQRVTNKADKDYHNV